MPRGPEGENMAFAYHVKVILPSGRARIHEAGCKFCRNGQGMKNQDKGTGPTYWHPPYPTPGFRTVAEAQDYVDGLSSRYVDIGKCPYCMKGQVDAERP
jgi:hypothetical protein